MFTVSSTLIGLLYEQFLQQATGSTDCVCAWQYFSLQTACYAIYSVPNRQCK